MFTECQAQSPLGVTYIYNYGLHDHPDLGLMSSLKICSALAARSGGPLIIPTKESSIFAAFGDAAFGDSCSVDESGICDALSASVVSALTRSLTTLSNLGESWSSFLVICVLRSAVVMTVCGYLISECAGVTQPSPPRSK